MRKGTPKIFLSFFCENCGEKYVVNNRKNNSAKVFTDPLENKHIDKPVPFIESFFIAFN